MHEVALIFGALESAIEAARGAGADRIQRVTFGLSPGGHVTKEAVATMFPALAAGTMAAEAAIEFSWQPRHGYCAVCGEIVEADRDDACFRCGGLVIHDESVADLVLLGIDVNTAAPDPEV